MIKKLIVSLSFGVMACTFGMDPVCYLQQMPLEIQKFIVRFLYETHEEFAERTIGMLNKSFTQSFYTNPQYPRIEYCRARGIPLNDEHHNQGLYVYSPERTKIAYLNPEKTLVVLHLEKAQGKNDLKCTTIEKVVYNKKLHSKCTQTFFQPLQIAISEQAEMLAIAGNEHDYRAGQACCLDIRAILKIEHLSTNKQKQFSMPKEFRYLWIDFNKQNTHLVVYGTPHKIEDNKRIVVKLFPLTTEENMIDFKLEELCNPATVQERAPLQIPTLKEHFKLLFICKNLTSLMDS